MAPRHQGSDPDPWLAPNGERFQRGIFTARVLDDEPPPTLSIIVRAVV